MHAQPLRHMVVTAPTHPARVSNLSCANQTKLCKSGSEVNKAAVHALVFFLCFASSVRNIQTCDIY